MFELLNFLSKSVFILASYINNPVSIDFYSKATHPRAIPSQTPKRAILKVARTTNNSFGYLEPGNNFVSFRGWCYFVRLGRIQTFVAPNKLRSPPPNQKKTYNNKAPLYRLFEAFSQKKKRLRALLGE